MRRVLAFAFAFPFPDLRCVSVWSALLHTTLTAIELSEVWLQYSGCPRAKIRALFMHGCTQELGWLFIPQATELTSSSHIFEHLHLT